MDDRTPRITDLARLTAGCAGFCLSLGYCAWRLATGSRHELARDVAHVMSRLVLRWSGIALDVTGANRLDESRPCVFAANHQSYLDYPIMAGVFPLRTLVLAKREIAHIPIVGSLFRLSGQPTIDRRNHLAARTTLVALATAIRRDDLSVWMFPEGTRNRVPGTLLPFKTGAFHLAVEASVPVVPVVLSPLRPLFDLERGVIRGRRVQLQILAPELPGSSASELRDRVRAAMLAALPSKGI